MSERGLVDWGLAQRVATALAREGERPANGATAPFGRDALAAACADAVDVVLGYTRLEPSGELPQPELVDRA
jgi:hypothetical protein